MVKVMTTRRRMYSSALLKGSFWNCPLQHCSTVRRRFLGTKRCRFGLGARPGQISNLNLLFERDPHPTPHYWWVGPKLEGLDFSLLQPQRKRRWMGCHPKVIIHPVGGFSHINFLQITQFTCRFTSPSCLVCALCISHVTDSESRI